MPMFGPMRECLLMQKSIRDQKFPNCPYVFFGKKGDRVADFRKAWKSACRRAGVVEKLIFHDLRRFGSPEHATNRYLGEHHHEDRGLENAEYVSSV